MPPSTVGKVACFAIAAFVLLLLSAGSASAAKVHPNLPLLMFGANGCDAGTGSASGYGTLTEGSTEITEVSTVCGAFEAGQEMSRATTVREPATAIRVGTTIESVGPGTLTLSRDVVESGADVLISSGPAFPSDPGDVALDQEERRLYVISHESHGEPGEIRAFDVSNPGKYQPIDGFDPLLTDPLGRDPRIAVDNSGPGSASQGNFYVSANALSSPEIAAKVYGFDSTGAPLPGFPVETASHQAGGTFFQARATAIAVDPDGGVWVTNRRWLEHFSASGEKLGEIDLSQQGTEPSESQPGNLGFDAAGNLFIQGGPAIWRYQAPGFTDTAPEVVVPKAGRTLTVDRGDGSLYLGFGGVGEPRRVERYSVSGEFLEEFGNLEKEGIGSSQTVRYNGVAIDEVNGWAYASNPDGNVSDRIDVYEAVEPPSARTDPASDPGATSITLNGTVSATLALSDCHFEYVTREAFEATGFDDLSSGGELECEPPFGSIPTDSEEHLVSAEATGLDPARAYRFRLVAGNANGTGFGQAVGFRLGSPEAETTGSPIRGATTVRFDGRLITMGSATEYHFEYGTAGPCGSNPCESTAPEEVAAGEQQLRLVSQQVSGLSPNTTYHYRLIADNGSPEGASDGGDRTVHTRPSDATPSHGPYPGPPGSDRAWEQVNLPNIGGNPVAGALGVSSSGDRALYRIAGGTPESQVGSTQTDLYAQRPPGTHPAKGWQHERVYPSRAQAPLSGWLTPAGSEDLSTITAMNTTAGTTTSSSASVWRIHPGGTNAHLFDIEAGAYGDFYSFSDDGSRALVLLNGSFDSDHPSAGSTPQLYDVGSGSPELVGLLPGDVVPSCGTVTSVPDPFRMPSNGARRDSRWITPDASRAFFTSAGNAGGCAPVRLFMHEFDAEESTRIDGPPLSGPDCSAAFIRSTDTAAFFWTQSRLDQADSTVSSCNNSLSGSVKGGDVYRYRFADEDLTCLTCGSWGPSDVYLRRGGAGGTIAVASDGSRLYFKSATPLVAGAPPAGSFGLYRLDIVAGELAYVGAIGAGNVGDDPVEAQGISADGSVIAFRSASASLNALGGQQNGNRAQYYLYDDGQRSLVCASCPVDGSAPVNEVPATGLLRIPAGVTGAGPNQVALAAGGSVFAFSSPDPLVNADQNTASSGQPAVVGTDIYEWRDGRQLLVTDGATSWPSSSLGTTGQPQISAITPSGRDLFFTAAAQLTPDAVDGYRRLYDARIGGGIDFPEEPTPCAPEDCASIPEPPEPTKPGSAGFVGPGNVKTRTVNCKATVRRARHQRKKAKVQHRRAIRLATRAKRLEHRPVLRRRALRRAARLRRGSKRRAHRAQALAKRARSCRAANGRISR